MRNSIFIVCLLLTAAAIGNTVLFSGEAVDQTVGANNTSGPHNGVVTKANQSGYDLSLAANESNESIDAEQGVPRALSDANTAQDELEEQTGQEAKNTSITSTPNEVVNALSGEEIAYVLDIDESDYYALNGRASSSLGGLVFDSKLLPSNEVKLQLTLERDESAPLVFDAYFDLANYVMELDGRNAVLDQDDKELLRVSSAQITNSLLRQYDGYEVPEHGFMLVRMLSYWSNSPEGYVHEKHVTVSR